MSGIDLIKSIIKKHTKDYSKEKNAVSTERASVTVEAAIVFPVFICLIISIIFIIKVVYVHGLIQHAISETANQIADMGYVFYISGAGDIHNNFRDGMDSRAELFRRHSADIMDSLDKLGGISGSKKIEDTIEEIAENPMEELKSIGFAIVSEAFSDIKTQVFLPAVRLNLKKYLKSEDDTDINTKLLGLNIENGFNGLDFSESSFLENQNNDIDIIVKYKMSLPLPVKLFPKILIVQRASARIWVGEGEAAQANEDDIWSLSNFERGTKLRNIFGANLPGNFPVIAGFKGGTANMIKSMDLTADSYQTQSAVKKKVYEYIDELANYQGQEKPWGSNKIVIKREEITQRKLTLIIPGNTLSSEINSELSKCIEYANSRGVNLSIEKYGMKKIDEKVEENANEEIDEETGKKGI